MLLATLMERLGFFDNVISCKDLEADQQQVTCKLCHVEVVDTYINRFVYEKCKDCLRRQLWDRMIHFAYTNSTIPCCIV